MVSGIRAIALHGDLGSGETTIEVDFLTNARADLEQQNATVPSDWLRELGIGSQCVIDARVVGGNGSSGMTPWTGTCNMVALPRAVSLALIAALVNASTGSGTVTSATELDVLINSSNASMTATAASAVLHIQGSTSVAFSESVESLQVSVSGVAGRWRPWRWLTMDEAGVPSSAADAFFVDTTGALDDSFFISVEEDGSSARTAGM